MLAVYCPHCGASIRMDDQGRLPPWCSKCGRTLRAEDMLGALEPRRDLSSPISQYPAEPPRRYPPAPKPIAPGCTAIQARPAEPARDAIQSGRTPRAAAPTVDVPDIALAPLPFWNARALGKNQGNLYRIYLTENELLFIEMQGSRDNSKQVARMTGFALGGLFGAALASLVVDGGAPAHVAGVGELLHNADEETLRLYAQREPNCRCRLLDGYHRIRVAPRSTWYRWFGGVEHEAVFTLWHTQYGKEAWALVGYMDVRKALEHLTQRVPDRLENHLEWGR